MSLEQIPTARRQVLEALKRAGRATIADLAQATDTSGESVRQQLLQLGRGGLVLSEQEPARGGAGRPASTYRLSGAGEALFAKAYAPLAVQLLDLVDAELGDDALERLLTRLTEARFVALSSVAGAKASRAAKLAALRALYGEGDLYLEVQEDGDTLRVTERNCPFLEVATARPLLCSTTVSVLTRLFGCRVVRERTFQAGHGCCVFRVELDAPCESEKFAREPPPEVDSP